MKAVIPAAGEGTRMGSLVEDRPKPMVEVGGRPIVERAVDQLADAGVEGFVLVVGYERDAIVDHLGRTHRGRPITYVDQPEPLGLADAVRRAAPHVDGPFVSFHGDNVVAAPLEPLVGGAGSGEDAAVRLPVREVDDETARSSTVCELDESGRVTAVVKRPSEPPSQLALCGLYRFDPVVFHACELVRPDASGEYRLVDALNLLLAAGHAVGTVPLEGDRVNVNTPADLERARRLVEG